MIRIIPAPLEPSWGPTIEELDDARSYEMTESVIEQTTDDIDDEDSDIDDFEDAAMLDAVEASALADQFHLELSKDEALLNFRGLSPVK